MEIDKSIRETIDRRLQTEYKNAVFVIQRALALALYDYDIQLEIIRLDFKSGLEALLKEKPIKAIFFGTRIGYPNVMCFYCRKE